MKKSALLIVILYSIFPAFSQEKWATKDEIISNLPIMKAIPGGVFSMGTDIFASKSEQGAAPAHRVELSSFIMAETLVTQRLWDLFIQDTGYRGYSYYHGYYGTVEKNSLGPNSPAIFMTWSEAVVFCNWLSERLGLSPAYSISGKLNPELRGGIEAQWIRGANGYRLITEAEWEYVMYERGSSRETLLEIYKDAFSRPQQKPLSEARNGQLTRFNIMTCTNFGISDMTWDEHGSFTNEPQKDPIGLSGLYSVGQWKVRRFFIGPILYNRLSMKIADNEGGFIGIRLAQDRQRKASVAIAACASVRNGLR